MRLLGGAPENDFLHKFSFAPEAAVPAMEYRNIANAYLSKHFTGTEDIFQLSVLDEVNQMLIADKVQNRKDFERYHQGSHENSEQLQIYFKNWLDKLGVSEARYQELAVLLKREFGEG